MFTRHVSLAALLLCPVQCHTQSIQTPGRSLGTRQWWAGRGSQQHLFVPHASEWALAPVTSAAPPSLDLHLLPPCPTRTHHRFPKKYKFLALKAHLAMQPSNGSQNP